MFQSPQSFISYHVLTDDDASHSNAHAESVVAVPGGSADKLKLVSDANRT